MPQALSNKTKGPIFQAVEERSYLVAIIRTVLGGKGAFSPGRLGNRFRDIAFCAKRVVENETKVYNIIEGKERKEKWKTNAI